MAAFSLSEPGSGAVHAHSLIRFTRTNNGMEPLLMSVSASPVVGKKGTTNKTHSNYKRLPVQLQLFLNR